MYEMLRERVVRFIVLVLLESKVAMRAEGVGQYPALFAFGDSILDTGNNNLLATVTKSNFPPYGRDFIGGRPTGRFGNGKVLSDLIAGALGIKDILPAYLDPSLSNEDLVTGVCFASAGSGLDDATARLQGGLLTISAQLQNFRAYIGRLKSVVGEAPANSIISNALFLISAGNNDVALTFNTLKIAMPFPLYVNQLIGWNNAFLQGLYQLGARKVWALSTLPLGCLPAGRTTAGGPLRLCAEAANGEARIFNAQLASSLQSLQSTLPGSSLRFIDVFTPFLNIIQNPAASGFVNAANGCCGTGTYEVAETCNMLVPSCPNPASYVFWDAAHPSQAAYERVVASILLSSKPKLINNYNASTYY